MAWNFTPTRARGGRVWNRCALFSRVDGKRPAPGRAAALIVSGVKETAATEPAPANEAVVRGEGPRALTPREKSTPTTTPEAVPSGKLDEREPLLQGMREAELRSKEPPAPAPKQAPNASPRETARALVPPSAPPAKAPEQEQPSARQRESAVPPAKPHEKEPSAESPAKRGSRAAQREEKVLTPAGRETATAKPDTKESASTEPPSRRSDAPPADSARRSTWEPGFSLVGSDFTFDKAGAGAGYPTANAEACRDLCLGHAPCAGWNFTGDQFPHRGLRNLCFLFSRKPSRHASNIAGVISGMIEDAR